jgi:hypothetical protein
MVKFINKALRDEISILLSLKPIISVGSIGGHSIEVEHNSPRSFDSYVYKNEDDLNHDFNLLKEMLENTA